MKNIISLISLLSILSFSVSAQSFRISHVRAGAFSFDKFNNEVYYVTFNSIYIKNLNDLTVRLCPFPSLPEFANHSHQCVYRSGDSIFVYNFNNSTKSFIYYPIDWNGYSFSPDDKYLLFYQHYFSFADSTIHTMDFSPDYDFEYQWTNETKLIFIQNENYMCAYNFVTNISDTLFVSPLYIPISTFAFNRRNNLLYYSLSDYEYPKIFTYNLSTHLDSIVFDTEDDSGDLCWETFNWFQSMEWSPSCERMAFFSFELDAGGTIHCYYPDGSRLYKYTFCGGDGYEYFMRWLNNDTIAYVNATSGYIEGFILDHPLNVNEIAQVTTTSFEISTYPNPFNGTVNINFRGKINNPEIKIYNINGEEVKRFENIRGSEYQFKQDWNGRNNSGENVSSGVYLVIVRDKDNPLSILGSFKIIYLK